MNTIAVVGASLAGLSAARALRGAGFTGRLVVIGEEKHDPYDRPPLSKDFLAGRQDVADISLAIPQDAELDIEWRLGQRATALRANGDANGDGYAIDLAGGDRVEADGMVVATGARARQLPDPNGRTSRLRGVHTLRTLDDALALRADVVPGARLTVVGGGFIGAEIASTAVELRAKVTLVELAATAMAAPLGEELGAVLAALHAERGVDVLTGVGVEALIADAAGESVAGVRLGDGREVPSDVVLVGIGSIPNTEWLAGSGIEGAGPDGSLSGGVLISANGATNLPHVVATGDCAATYSRFAGRVVRYEHWTNALQHPALAAATLLGAEPPTMPATATVPYFWSDQYGMRLQFAGHYHPGDTVEVVDGDLAEHRFVAVYRRDGVPVAVLGIGIPKVFARWRRQLAADAPSR
jgi:3-phenylpropionate/trans-cinnamate dioxygenase ferredoxin reductase component